jgi:EAL and modified HD-GYP domain-containing signal transduction protein
MEHFIARQPIFDRELRVFAYELLFRSGFDNFYDALDGDQASSDVLTTSFMLVGLEELTSGKKASINFTRRLILNEVATLFPSDLLLVEVLENVEPAPEVIEACKDLKRAGYRLILDDFCPLSAGNPLLKIVDIVKVDFAKTQPRERELIPLMGDCRQARFLAEKVETAKEFSQALDWNYSYFQGYFFSHPVIHSSNIIPGSKLAYLRILNEINRPETDFSQLEAIIKCDVSLSYKLLRFMNSAYFGFYERIRSIRQALTLLGLREVKKWVSLAALTSLASDRPEELIVNSLVRARLCEQLALRVGLGDRTSELFLMGMFSMIDAIAGKPMSEILGNLPITEEVKVALMGGENRFRDVFDMLVSYERGEWGEFAEHAANLKIEENDLPVLYRDSVRWVGQVLQQTGVSAK